jgi:hypothetical protein
MPAGAPRERHGTPSRTPDTLILLGKVTKMLLVFRVLKKYKAWVDQPTS